MSTESEQVVELVMRTAADLREVIRALAERHEAAVRRIAALEAAGKVPGGAGESAVVGATAAGKERGPLPANHPQSTVVPGAPETGRFFPAPEAGRCDERPEARAACCACGLMHDCVADDDAEVCEACDGRGWHKPTPPLAPGPAHQPAPAVTRESWLPAVGTVVGADLEAGTVTIEVDGGFVERGVHGGRVSISRLDAKTPA